MPLIGVFHLVAVFCLLTAEEEEYELSPQSVAKG
jgi:hypothetical protein